MYGNLVLPVLILSVHASHAFSHSTCDSSNVCKYYKQCEYYQDLVKQIKQEKNIEKRIDLVTNLKSRVCDRVNRFVCCPVEVDKLKQTRNNAIDSPTFLPTLGECGKVEGKLTPLVGVLFNKE